MIRKKGDVNPEALNREDPFDELYDARMENPIADIAAGFIPGIGNALAAQDFKRDLQDENYGMAALSGLGMIPFVGGIAKPFRAMMKAANPGIGKGAFSTINKGPLSQIEQGPVVNKLMSPEDLVRFNADTTVKQIPGMGQYISNLPGAAASSSYNAGVPIMLANMGRKAKRGHTYHHEVPISKGGTQHPSNIMEPTFKEHDAIHAAIPGDRASNLIGSATDPSKMIGAMPGWKGGNPTAYSAALNKALKQQGLIKPNKSKWQRSFDPIRDLSRSGDISSFDEALDLLKSDLF